MIEQTGREESNNSIRIIDEATLSNNFLGQVIEICTVTRDYKRTMAEMVALGIGPWRVYTFNSDTVTEQTYMGEPADYSIKVCFAEAPNVIWEIMQPLSGPSIFSDFLEEHGEGIHHVAFDCKDAQWETRIQEFESRGFHLVQSGKWMDQNAFAFFTTENKTGSVFETYFFPPGFEYPQPEEWYPA